MSASSTPLVRWGMLSTSGIGRVAATEPSSQAMAVRPISSTMAAVRAT